MKTALIIAFTALVLTSCQKELDFNKPLSPAASGKCASGTYMPLTTGTNWSYVIGSSTQASTVTILPGDTTINGFAWKRALQQGVAGQPDVMGYIRETNGNVYDFVNLPAAGVASGYVQRTLLKPNEPVGGSWSDTAVINGITEIFKNEIVGKGLTMQIDSLRFSNVIHVRQTVSFDFPPIFNNEVIMKADYYFAQCVGPIKSVANMMLLGQVVNTVEQKIKSYVIK
jgi:hypothetical protein